MEIKEAVEQLKSLQENRRSFLEDDAEHDSIFMQDYEAIETVLAELEKYENKIILTDEEYRKVIDEAQKDCVPNDKISEKIEYLKLNCGHAFVIDTLEDLLKEE